MKTLASFFGLLLSFFSCNSQNKSAAVEYTNITPIYQFTVKDITGKSFDLSTLKGKKIMIVNTASKCGYTPQYADLEKLYQTYKDREFVIIGFPANNFLHQEPGADSTIAQFCQLKYNVTFPMMAKVSVKGEDQDPLFKYLTTASLNGFNNDKVSWNFNKFLINREGFLERVFKSGTEPLDAEITKWIEKP